MYLIRYQTDQGALTQQEMTSWDEAISCWESLMADHTIRILPDPRTGLEISILMESKCDGLPNSWTVMVA
jgi:predicted oxidoreductase